MTTLYKSILILAISLLAFAASVATALAAQENSSSQSGSQTESNQNSMSSLENILKTLQQQRTQAATDPNAPQVGQQQPVNNQQLSQYYAEQNQLLSKIKQQNDQAKWQSLAISIIYLITLIFLWIFLWYGISALRTWMRIRR